MIKRIFLILVSTLVGIFAIAWVVWEIWPSSDLPRPPSSGYVDMHVHAAGLGHLGSGNFVHESLRSNFRFGFYLRAFDVSEEEVKQQGDGIVLERIHKKIEDSIFVDEAVILALDGVVDEEGELDPENTVVYVSNQFLIEQLRQYDNLFLGASINPYRHDALDRLKYVVGEGAVLLKWIPSIMEIDPSDPELVPFYTQLAEIGLPLLTHTGRELSFGSHSDDLRDPQRIKLALSLGVTVIAAHIATTGETDGEQHYDRIQSLFDPYPNFYADISSLTQVNKRFYLQDTLARGEHLDRLMNGSDWPLQFFPIVSPLFHLYSISLSDAKAVHEIENQWDRDIVLKKMMGVPEHVFQRSGELLGIPGTGRSSEKSEEDREINYE